ncbi:MAG: hypothetical protein IT558_02255 [Alphaproteobacteria bacterium]|nr:hypothetical protein [Alphaproteobacteria bacterium]
MEPKNHFYRITTMDGLARGKEYHARLKEQINAAAMAAGVPVEIKILRHGGISYTFRSFHDAMQVFSKFAEMAHKLVIPERSGPS